MINKIVTQNYHSHKNSTIEFCAGVNIITGASDAGKSDILRQMRWVFNNRPTGNSVKSWWSDKNDETSVCITTSEGHCLKKRISDKVLYELEINNEKTSFEAVKTDVPIEVSNFFNFSDFNYQSQHSGYLLLAESSGEVAKKLNELVGLSIIDIIFKNLASKALENKRKSEEESKKSTELLVQIEKLNYLDDIDILLADIKKIINDHDKRTTSNNNLFLLISTYQKTNNNIQSYSKILCVENEFKNIKKQIDNYNIRNTQYRNLLSIITKSKNCNAIIDKESKLLLIEKDIKTLIINVDLHKNKKTQLFKLQNIINNLKNIIVNIKLEKEWLLIDNDCKSLRELISNYDARYINVLRLKKIIAGYKLSLTKNQETNILNNLVEKKRQFLVNNKICPLCKTQLTAAIIETMI